MLTEGLVPMLISDLRERLNELEQERRVITRALRALEPAPVRGHRRSVDKVLLERLRMSPGSRASLLALELGIEAAVVTSGLLRLEETGQVARAGMGWETIG
jgi:predicted Rossmann fold nucleotide-binding protein DprA/Smf involved in DNA uptake